MRLPFQLIPALLVVILSIPAVAGDGAAGSSPGSVILVQAAQDPLEDPEAVQDRVETGSSEDVMLHEGNRLLFGILILIFVLLVWFTAVWAFRRGRQNKPVSGRQ